MKERKTTIIDGFLGVDFTTSPLKVNQRRACSGYNFISDYGTLKKRNGWLELIKFNNKKIKGIYQYFNNTDDFMIVRASDKFYKLSKDFTTYSTLLTLAEVVDENVQFHQYDDKVVISGCGKLLLFYHNGTTYVIDDLANHAYVPTTTISIDDKSINDPVRVSYERPNILSRRRKNTLHGSSSANREWILDGVISFDIDENPVYIHIEVESMTNNVIQKKEYHVAWVETSPGVEELQILDDSDVKVGRVGSIFKNNVVFQSTIIFDIATTPPIEGMDNITVTYDSEYSTELNDLQATKLGIVYGVNGQNNQLFLANGSKEYFSAAFDYSYFPDDQIITLGNPNNPIVGYERLSDTSLVIFKDNKSTESRLYYRTLTLETNEQAMLASYRNYDRAVGESIGCDAPKSIENLAGDHLFLSRYGVYGITLGDNISVEQRHVRERSLYINKHLSARNITNAKAIVYDNRYYLAVGDSVYVADARYRSASDMDDTFNYEWYYFENVPVNTWFVMDNELYFGTEEGRICKFDDLYSDRTLIRASEGEVTVVVDENYLVHSADIPVKENDEIVATCYELAIPYTEMIVDVGLVTVNHDVENVLEDGMGIYVFKRSSVLTDGVKYIISDLLGNQFRLKNTGGSYVAIHQPFDLLIDLSDTTLLTTNVDDENDKFQLKRYVEGQPIKVVNYDSSPITFEITIHEPVKMLWYSAIMDLGTNMFTKTLFALTISADAATTGKIDFGFDTRNISNNIQSLNFKLFDFNDIDFQNFTFLTAIASSFTKQVKEKDFNFIILKLGSETPSSAIINSLSLLYKINQMNRGIR